MKIGILTLPLRSNYGGIIQAYALQLYLKQRGHHVVLIDRFPNISFFQNIKNIIRRSIFIRQENNRNFYYSKVHNFIGKYIAPKTIRITSEKVLRKIVETYQFDAIVVGSDQVWRLEYSSNLLLNYFLDFISNQKIKKIAYSVSFGINDFTLPQEKSEKIIYLVNQFEAISVREDTGIGICRRVFNKDVIHTLDPTLLLDKTEYINLIQNYENSPNSTLFSYLLDTTSSKEEIASFVATKLCLETYKMNFSSNKSENELYPCLTEWLNACYQSSYIITDSFHGCVFSIIFNKPFIVIGNKQRGLSRFFSLLRLLKLENRIIFEISDIDNEMLLREINWEKVNNIVKELRLVTNDFFSKVDL